MGKKYDSETISFNLDISKLKKEFNDAATIIRTANSEFKKSSAGLDDWSKDADGVTAKCKQLNTIIEAQCTQLSSLEKQYKKVAEREGENSTGAQNLLIQINNLKASIKNNEKQLSNYTDSLKKLNEQNVDTRSSAQRLSDAIDSQEKELEKLKDDYASIIISQGKGSDEARRLSDKISNLSGELNQNKEKLSQARDAADRFDDSLKKLNEQNVDTRSSAQRLSDAIDSQEKELEKLKDDYASIIISQGKGSDEARRLSDKISDLSGELHQNKEKLSQARDAADRFDDSLDDTGDSAEETSSGFTVLKGALANLIADGIKAAISGFKDLTEEMLDAQGAYNNFQTKTGASKEEMKQFTEQMDELYKNNYGESLNDVADSMAKVSQYTGEVNPENLKKLTENAYAFSETFDADFDESLRGADGLMKNMGLTADEAFDLMAKGAQNGLDKSGELGDNIAEYSQLWGQAGFSAQEMFGVLENGLENGAYNLDKVNDFVKEFGVSLTDGRFEDNIDSFSDSTQSLFKQWQNGKATTKDVFMSVIADLNDTKTEQEALTTASSVWSSLGEDNALKVIRSLGNVNENYKSVKGTMEDIKKVKYDDLQSDMSSLGRTIQTDIIKPVLDKGLPKIRKAVKEYTPEIKRVVSDCVAGIVKFLGKVVTNFDDIKKKAKIAGTAIGAMFITNKIIGFVTGIMKLVKTYTTLKAAIEATTTAQKLMNLTNPAGIATLAAGAVGGLVMGIANLIAENKKAQKGIVELSADEQALRDRTNEVVQAYDDWSTAKSEVMESVSEEYGAYERLLGELDKIVDKNGKVKEGYENRATTITGILSEATGIEMKMIDGQIDKYDKLKDKIEETLKMQQAQAIQEGMKDAYVEASTNITKAARAHVDNMNKLHELHREYAKAQDEQEFLLNASSEQFANWKESTGFVGDYEDALEGVRKRIGELEPKYIAQITEFRKSREAYVDYATTIQNYDAVSDAILKKDADAINESLLRLKNGFQTAETGTKETLEAQLNHFKENLKALEQALRDGMPGVTQAHVDEAKKLVDAAQSEYDKAPESAYVSGLKTAENYSYGEIAGMANAVANAKEIAEASSTGLEDADFYASGAKNIADYVKGQWGAKPSAENASRQVAEGSKQMLYIDASSEGHSFITGFANGISNGSGLVYNVVGNVASWAVGKLRHVLDINSPSRITRKIGLSFSEGFSMGIANGAKDVIGSVKALAKDAIDTMDRETEGFGNSIFGSVNAGLPQLRRAITPSTAISGGSVVNNNYSTTSNCSYNQTNISPEPLRRIDIYRQTKNLISQKGV